MDLIRNIIFVLFVSVAYALQQDFEERPSASFKYPELLLSAKVEEFKSLLNEASPVLSTIQSKHSELTSIQNDIVATSEALERSRRSIRETLDNVPESCVNVEGIADPSPAGCSHISNDTNLLVSLGYNATFVGLSILKSSIQIMAEVQSCPSINFYKAYQCYIMSIEAMGDLLKYARSEGSPIMHEAVILSKQLLADIQACLFSSKSTEGKLYQHIKSNNSC